MAANAVSYEVATRERLEDMLAMDLTPHQMAERLGIAERSVSRALRRHDLVPPRAPHFQLTFEQEARVEILLKEGMPLTWIAEDLQVPMNVLRHRVTVPPVNAQGWQSSWGSILHNPELLKLHREFAPRDVPESWVRMGVAS